MFDAQLCEENRITARAARGRPTQLPAEAPEPGQTQCRAERIDAEAEAEQVHLDAFLDADQHAEQPAERDLVAGATRRGRDLSIESTRLRKTCAQIKKRQLSL